LFTIEISECGVGCAERAAVFFDNVEVAGPFVGEEVLEKRMDLKAGFGDGLRCSDNLGRVKSIGERSDSRSGLSMCWDVSSGNIHVEFEGFTFHVIRFKEAIVGILLMLMILIGVSMFSREVAESVSETAEISVRFWGFRIGGGDSEFLE
jgi:hypothetical protein